MRGGNILPNKYIFKDDDIFVSDEFVNANTILKKNCIITPAVTSLENIGKMAVIEKTTIMLVLAVLSSSLAHTFKTLITPCYLHIFSKSILN